MNSKPLEESATVESAKAVQIIAPISHEFQLDVESLKQILESDEIKDRYAVVISIAGALRKGKSFLLNFILKYLNAQVRSNTFNHNQLTLTPQLLFIFSLFSL